jgi:hypothetical protein
MKKYIIPLLTVLVLSCQNKTATQKSAETEEQTTEQNDSTTENDTLSMDFLKLTDMEKEKIKMYAGKYHTYAADYDVTEDEITVQISVLHQYLKRNGYKFAGDSAFNTRINQIFGIDRRKNTYEVIEHSDFFTYVPFDFSLSSLELTISERAAFIKELELQEFRSIVFVKKYNFIISPTFPLGVFFDKREGDDEFVFIQRAANRMKHYNKYLFNDSQASLTWLLVNEQRFLTRLVKEFGYDKVPRINKMVLDNACNKFQKTQLKETGFLENLFAVKEFNGSFRINEGLLQYVVDNTTVDDNRYLDLLYNYANILSYNYTGYKDYMFDNFTKNEKLKIAAYAGYYIELAYRNNGIKGTEQKWKAKSFLRNEFAGNEDLLPEIEKNNYYGLPDFAGMIDEIMLQISETNTNTYIIEDPDGYVNVREGKGTSYNITGTIPSGKRVKLLISSKSSDWWRVKYQDIVGYVHKSRIKQL